MAQYYVLDTQEQSNACRLSCYIAHIGIHNTEPYKSQTTQWSKERTRLTDGKYIVPFCGELGQAGYTVEESDESWFT